jgi:predicted nucleotidyltransferase
MRPSEALRTHRAEISRLVLAHQAVNPRVFGSVVHGDDGDDSDLDLLIDALPGATLFDLGGLQDELESLLGVRIDLLTPSDLPPKLRTRILAEAQPI